MKRFKKLNLVKYIFIFPIFALISVIYIYPLFRVIFSSFFNIRSGAREGLFVGLENYRTIFAETIFWNSVSSTAIWIFGNLVLQIIIPLGIAILLNHKLKGTHFYRTFIMLPWIIPMVALAVPMKWMLLPEIGVFNQILKSITGTQINFLSSPGAAMPTLIIFNTWKFLPLGTLIILAALQTIPEELYEAAHVDGANFWRQFIYITLPFLSKMIWFSGFLVIVWNFDIFDAIWLTTKGGPGHTMQLLTILIYRRAFKTFRFGEGSAIATVCILCLCILGVLYFKFLSPKRENEI